MKLAQKIFISEILETSPPGYGNLIGCDQKPRLMPVSGRIAPCPSFATYINVLNLSFEAFASSLYSLSNLSPKSKFKGPKLNFKASNL